MGVDHQAGWQRAIRHLARPINAVKRREKPLRRGDFLTVGFRRSGAKMGGVEVVAAAHSAKAAMAGSAQRLQNLEIVSLV